MSLVAVKKYDDKILISADTISTIGDLKLYREPKLFKINEDFIIGHVGNSNTTIYINSWFNKYFKTHTFDIIEATEIEIKDIFLEFYKYVLNDLSISENDDHSNSFLIVFKKKIFYIGFKNNKLIVITEIFDCFGIGYKDYALGAMFAGATPEEAVRISSELCIYVSEPITTFEIKL